MVKRMKQSVQFGPLVKRLRHGPLKAETGVRIPLAVFCVTRSAKLHFAKKGTVFEDYPRVADSPTSTEVEKIK